MAVPIIPILPICFQCGTNQNPCHCKVVGPTLGMSSRLVLRLRLRFCWSSCLCSRIYWDSYIWCMTPRPSFYLTNSILYCARGGIGIDSDSCFAGRFRYSVGVAWRSRGRSMSLPSLLLCYLIWLIICYSMLAFPVDLNGKINNAIPIWRGCIMAIRMDLYIKDFGNGTHS